MGFVKAERKRAKARILIEGPSGSGKSYSALRLAKGLGGRIAAIDTEHGSLSMYSDVAPFDVLELSAPFSPDRYIAAIHEAEEAGYDVLIIDSITHEWSGEGGILDIVEKTPAPGGNSFARWASVTPKHNRFIETMLQSPIHVIATTRSKTDWQLDDKKPKKVGLAPQQRDGIDYEFTMVFTVQSGNHVASVSKDRTGQFDTYLQVIDEQTGKRIADWLGSGAEAPAPTAGPEARPEDTDEAYRSTLIHRCREAGLALGKERLKPLAKGRKPEQLEVPALEALTDELEAAVEAMMAETDTADYEPGGEG